MSSLGPESRALLDEGRDALRPGVDDRERVLAAMHTRMAVSIPDPIGEAASPAATSSLSWPIISTVLAGLAFGGGFLLHRLGTAEAVSAPAAPMSSPRPRASVSPAAAPAPAPQDTAPAAPAPSAEQRGRAPNRTDSLAEEVALLSSAQRELHSGRFTAALTVLGEHQRKFPRGALGQERVAARIQALCGLGRVKEADAELARVSPESLHAARVREACSPNKAK